MAFSRMFLKSLGLTDEQVQAVIEEHTAVTDALKKFKEDAGKLADVQKELDDLKEATADYETIKKDLATEKQSFADYKKQVEGKETLSKVKDAYKELLKEAKIDSKRIDAILRITDWNGMKLNTEGKLEGADKLTESIKKDYAEFVVKEGSKGAEPETPPADENNSNDAATAKWIRERAAKRHAGIYGETKGAE